MDDIENTIQLQPLCPRCGSTMNRVSPSCGWCLTPEEIAAGFAAEEAADEPDPYGDPEEGSDGYWHTDWRAM